MAAAYVDVADLLVRSDRNDVAELASDDGTPIPEVALPSDPIVNAILEDAEGEVIANLLSGGRYSTEDLDLLTGSALSFLKRMICAIAMLHLYARRPSWKPELLDSYAKLSEMYFKKMASGEAIFGGDSNREGASLASVDGPSLSDIRDLNMITDRSGYFRRRVLPNGRNI